jgi:hypothetical protein
MSIYNILFGTSCPMEQNTVVRFFTLKKLSGNDMATELEGMSGHEAPSLSAAKKSDRPFANGTTNLKGSQKSETPAESDLCELLSKKIFSLHANAYV